MVAQKNLCVLILAAGKGTRMKSSLPKPLHPVCGLPMIAHSLRAAQTLHPGAICVVVGHEAPRVMDEIKQNLSAWGITAPIVFAEQKELNGSAGAVRAALPLVEKFKTVMVLNGDAPLVRGETLQQMHGAFEQGHAQALVWGVQVPDSHGYGRILRNPEGGFERIVEESETDETTRAINEVNGGMYVFDVKALVGALALLTPQGPKHEFYLTDTLSLIQEAQGLALVFPCADYKQALGVNSRADLAVAEGILRARINQKLMENGVRLVRPEETYIDEDVQIGADSSVCPGSYILGKTTLGTHCQLEGGVSIYNCTIGNNVKIKYGSYLENSVIEDGCEVGPYAHLRPGSTLKAKAKVGNFCEVKNSVIGAGSKVNHLTYIGDTDMGPGVNIGAGTITCNYDGQKKHRTVIGAHCFVGSNVNFVAPVEIQPYSKIGAGSTITKQVPEGSLAIARARQVVLENKGVKKHD